MSPLYNSITQFLWNSFRAIFGPLSKNRVKRPRKKSWVYGIAGDLMCRHWRIIIYRVVIPLFIVHCLCHLSLRDSAMPNKLTRLSTHTNTTFMNIMIHSRDRSLFEGSKISGSSTQILWLEFYGLLSTMRYGTIYFINYGTITVCRRVSCVSFPYLCRHTTGNSILWLSAQPDFE